MEQKHYSDDAFVDIQMPAIEYIWTDEAKEDVCYIGSAYLDYYIKRGIVNAEKLFCLLSKEMLEALSVLGTTYKIPVHQFIENIVCSNFVSEVELNGIKIVVSRSTIISNAFNSFAESEGYRRYANFCKNTKCFVIPYYVISSGLCDQDKLVTLIKSFFREIGIEYILITTMSHGFSEGERAS